MLNVLMETEPKKEKRLGGTMVSVAMHAILITLVVAMSARAGTDKPKKPREGVNPIYPPETSAPKPQSPSSPRPQVSEPRDFPELPPLPGRFQDSVAPIEIPDSLPNVEWEDGGVSAEELSSSRSKRGGDSGVVRGASSGDPASVFSPDQVERKALAADGNPRPQYPYLLRESNVEGQVLAEFVVDTTGRADMNSFKVLESSHDLFVGSVRSVLPLMRFYAAEVGGRKVKQLVHQSFTFRINR